MPRPRYDRSEPVRLSPTEKMTDGGANALLVVDDYNFKLVQSLHAHAPLHAIQGDRAVELVDTVRARIKSRMAQSFY